VTADPLTMPALLRRRAETDPDLAALVSESASITYRELDQESLSFAGWLVGQGVVKGSRVGLMMHNGVDWAVAALGVMRIGAVLAPLSTFLKPKELRQQLGVAAVTHLIIVEGFRGRDYVAELSEAVKGFDPVARRLRRDASLPSLRAAWCWTDIDPASSGPAMPPMAQALEARVNPSDDLAIIFTSGSRGAPKGVIHTHGGALRAVACSLEARRLEAGDRLYIPMPFFWTGGFASGLLSVMVAGATLLTEAEPEPARTLGFLETQRATLFRGWPAQAAALSRHPGFGDADLSSLKPGSLEAVLPAALRGPSGARANLFGMTESFGPYSGARLDEDLPESARGSCGRPFEGVEVRIIDRQTGAPCDVEQTGVIQLRGPNMMRGICGHTREEVFTPDGFYATGDLGRLDAAGYLFFAGRGDDLFKVKGITVNPEEIEAELRALPGVARAHVTDVRMDAAAEPEVGAVVLLQKDAACDVADLAAAARRQMSSFKAPSRWVLLRDAAAVPVLPTGKVDRAGLQALLRDSGRNAP
jgi:acyl-coenzyme A synthetase/AMP-(fatty) acid ligase